MKSSDFVLAILSEAQKVDAAPLLKTALMKYLYLLDVYAAEETQGRTATGWEWRFLHFGPFSNAAAESIDRLAATREIVEDRREAQAGDHEFALYSLTEHKRVADLQQLGLAGSITLRIQTDLQRYRRDLSRLLDYVYFRTAPMSDVTPGQVLNFSDCSKMTINDVRPVAMQPLRQKAIKQARERLRALVSARKASKKVPEGPYDEAYQSALHLLDAEPVPVGVKGSAKINTK